MVGFSAKAAMAFSVMAALAAAPFGSAFAQASNSTNTDMHSSPDPAITITTGFARFSYGIVGLTVAIENPVASIDEVNVRVYDPDGGVVSDKDEVLHFNTFDNKSYFQSYYFSVERKYVYDSYEIVASYANQSEIHSVPPFSSEFPQPPDISIERIQVHESGSVGISGRAWGGIGNERLDMDIYSPGGELATTLTARLGLHAQFDAGVSAGDARSLFAQSGEYRIVADLVGTDAPKVERTFEYSRNNQSDPSTPQQQDAMVALNVSAADSDGGDPVAGIQVTLLQGGTVIATQSSPASFSVDKLTEYVVSVDDSDDYQFDRWQDTGSKSTQRNIMVAEATTLTAVYRAVDKGSDDDEQEEETEREGGGAVPAVRSPFKFLPKTTETLTAEAEEPEATLENGEEVLTIKGRIGSYAIGLPVNAGSDAQEYLHILSGNWSLTVGRDNNAAGLQANFTSVRADGADRHVHTLAMNATTTASVQFDDQLEVITISNLALNVRTDGGAAESVNATVTILRLNTIKIDLDSKGVGQLLDQPVYGVTTTLEHNGIEAPIGAGQI